MERTARVISKLKLPPGTVRPDQLAKAAWPLAVGPRIAAHTTATWFEENRLVVEVGDAIWQIQLTSLKGQILRRLEEVIGQELVSKIDFRLRVRRREPQRSSEARPCQDEADRIADPVLRTLYRQQRRKRSA